MVDLLIKNALVLTFDKDALTGQMITTVLLRFPVIRLQILVTVLHW